MINKNGIKHLKQVKQEDESMQGKTFFSFRMSLAITISVVVLSLLLLSLANYFSSRLRGAFWKSVPEYSDLSENQIMTDQYVKGYQINSSGDGVIFLTGIETHQNVYIWDPDSGTTEQLNSDPIPSNIKSLNIANHRTTTVAFVDEEKNIYFESSNYLIKVDPENKVVAYENLPMVLHTPKELATKTVSSLYKRIFEKYSKEQIVVLKNYDSPVVAYLIEIDGKYYYNQYDTSRNPEQYTLWRYNTKGETVENLQSNEFRTVEYDGLWDSSTQTINPKGKIRRIAETIAVDPKVLNRSEIKYPEVQHLLDYDKHQIVNDSYKTHIQRVCYKELFPVDRTCRARRTLLNIGLREYVLPNFEIAYGGVLLDEPEDTSFIYVPYNNHFFTSNGKFIFLSQDNKLFAL